MNPTVESSPVHAEYLAYQAAETRLLAAVEKAFPLGSWVKVTGRPIVGKVHSIAEANPGMLWLVLEHGCTRIFSVDALAADDVPAWAKCQRCDRNLVWGADPSNRYGWGCKSCTRVRDSQQRT